MFQPKFYSMNQLYMGDTLSRLGRKEEARQCYYRAFNAPVVTVDDVTAKNKAYDAMKKMGMTEKEMIAVGGL
jgi:predicted negative regulator of RcsB-dependent stress response